MNQTQEQILVQADALADEGSALVIEISRVDRDVSDRVHALCMRWRTLVLAAGDIPDDGLETLRRRFEVSGE